MSAEDPPVLTRTKTTVSTDYQFSPCYVQQLTNNFFYDYEYLGPSTSLVIAPLTERSILSLTQSLKSFHCSTLIGPAGTGKTETVRHLAKVCWLLGRLPVKGCLTFDQDSYIWPGFVWLSGLHS